MEQEREAGREGRVAATIKMSRAVDAVHGFLVAGGVRPDILPAALVVEFILDGLGSRPDALPSREGVTIHFTAGVFRHVVHRLEIVIQVASAVRFKRQHLLEVVARALGFQSWHVLSAKLKTAKVSGGRDLLYVQAVERISLGAQRRGKELERANGNHDERMPVDDGSQRGLRRSISGSPFSLVPVDALAVQVVFKSGGED